MWLPRLIIRGLARAQQGSCRPATATVLLQFLLQQLLEGFTMLKYIMLLFFVFRWIKCWHFRFNFSFSFSVFQIQYQCIQMERKSSAVKVPAVILRDLPSRLPTQGTSRSGKMSNFAVSQKAGCEEIIQKLDNPNNLQIKTKCFPDWVDSSLAAQRAEKGGWGLCLCSNSTTWRFIVAM